MKFTYMRYFLWITVWIEWICDAACFQWRNKKWFDANENYFFSTSWLWLFCFIIQTLLTLWTAVFCRLKSLLNQLEQEMSVCILGEYSFEWIVESSLLWISVIYRIKILKTFMGCWCPTNCRRQWYEQNPPPTI